MADAIALYPFPGMGHLIAMVELGKLILTHHPTFSITIIISTAQITTASTAKLVSNSTAEISAYIAAFSAANPSMTFHHLPTIPSLPDLDPLNLSFELARLHIPNIRHTLQTLSKTSNLRAFIIDIFCDAAFDVAKELNIPIFYLYTSAGNSLCMLLNVPIIHRTTNHLSDFGDVPVTISGIPPIPVPALPKIMFHRTAKVYRSFVDTATHMAISHGILLNTFELLESRALKALRDGLVLTNQPTPPVFAVGPLVHSATNGNRHECLSWLDNQPKRSVLFLCFGSMGVFSAEQLSAMALGLERSGQRFLWVVRNPPRDEESEENQSEPSLEDILPNGFLGRIKDKGLVVRQWAPQVDVLSHESVGGFVTHCGWNSVLESVCAGVPMVAWPLYAEQKLCRVVLVEELKAAVAVNESEDGFVSADELEKRVTELMESERGAEVRERVLAFKNGAVAAMEDSGSSIAELAKLVELWKQS